MSFNSIKTKLGQEKGFTIVELLIVIVVIGILAAITIVSFNGVTANANAKSAQSSAASAAKKIEAFAAENSGVYPTTFASLTGTTQSARSWYLTGVTFATAAYSTQPASPSTLMLYSCTTAGMRVGWWKYDAPTSVQFVLVGDTSGTCTTLVTT